MTATPDPRPAPMPIAAAFEEAARQRAAEDAAQEEARQKDKDRQEDAASILRMFGKGGMAAAQKQGKIYGWTRAEVEALCRPPAEPAAHGDRAPRPSDGFSPPRPPEGDPDAPPPPVKRKNPVKRLPANCPVLPLGTMGGEFYYLTPLKELTALKKHGADDVRALFAERTTPGANGSGIDWLWEHFAKFDKQGRHNGWDISHAGESLMTECAARGVFDPGAMLRGVGAWTDEAGGLVIHCGDAVYSGGEWTAPGLHDGYVYPGARATPRPLDEAADDKAARELLALFDKWPWQFGGEPDTPEILHFGGFSVSPAALMLLGWTGCALIGGALAWRPMVWVTGDAGGGKSTLQSVVSAVFGGGLVQSSDATSAGIYQRVGYSSLAVAIDEAESDPFSTKMKHMVELVRQSASGGTILRGSNDAKFKAFTARSAFLLSSIILPSLNAQDLTRLAVLRLGRLGGTTPPKIDNQRLRQLGRALRRRIVDGWADWPARLDMWRSSLAHVGHDARGCDQYGALFAMADLLLHDRISDQIDRLYWAEATRHLVAERRTSSNADTMLDWILTKPIDNVFRGGQQYTVRSLLMAATGLKDIDGGMPSTCANVLKEKGIVVDTSAGTKEAARIILLNQHAGLAELFRGTVWGTAPGAANSGWSQAMGRMDGAQSVKKYGSRAWSVPALVFLKGAEE